VAKELEIDVKTAQHLTQKTAERLQKVLLRYFHEEE
jgi:F0F1-type ATP synthase delta subunit